MLCRQDSTFESIIWDQQMPDVSSVVCVTVGNYFISLSFSGLVYKEPERRTLYWLRL